MADLPYDQSVFYQEIVEIKEALKDIAEILRTGLLSEKETDVSAQKVFVCEEVKELNPIEELTEGDECRIAREIVKLLRQNGASYNQSVRILKNVKKRIREIPLTQ